MARRRHEGPRDRFSTTEVAKGCGLSPRNIMYLCSKGLVPVAAGGEGRGRHRQLDYEGLARVAVIAAFYNAGIEIYLASRLVHEIGQETDFHKLANLERFLSRPQHSAVISIMHDDGLDPEHAFYLHETLRRRSNNYRPHRGMEYDRLIEVFDRLHVFLNYLLFDRDKKCLVATDRPSVLFKIADWKKGTESVEIQHTPPQRMGKLPPGWAGVRGNFKGMFRVNVSLAIRDALDAIAAAREV